MSKNRIHLKGEYRQEEAVAGEADIYPGMLLKLNSAGAVVKHTTLGGAIGDENLVAAEDALQGKSVADVYTVGEIVTYLIPVPGTVLNVLVAVDENIAIGDKLVSEGTGMLAEIGSLESATLTGKVVGVSEEALNLVDSASDVDTLCAVRFV